MDTGVTGPTRKAIRSLIVLAGVILVMLGTLFAGITWGSATWMPKLGLDLRGGTEILLKAQTDNGRAPSAQQMNQAVNIIRQRVDSTGVSEAQITTQGSSNIDIALPGNPSQATIDLVKASAKLEFRQVWATNDSGTDSISTVQSPALPKLSGLSTKHAQTREEAAQEIVAAYSQYGCQTLADSSSSKTGAADQTATSGKSASASASASPSASSKASASPQASASASPKTKPSNPVPEKLTVAGVSRSDLPLLTCDRTATAKYLLGPVQRDGSKASGRMLDGSTLTDATAGLQQTSTGASTSNWVVNMTFNSLGSRLFGQVTTSLVTQTAPQNRFAIVLDGRVVSAPTINSAITNGQAQIEGSFTQNEAQTLADQLKYGALPLNFVVQSQDHISPTLGSSQLNIGLLAGLIGLLLVVAYSVFQYRALGGVTILSLAISAVITLLLISIMSWAAGYRLSLAGVAGLIVSIGITADSFIVYFERIRDELRDGHSLVSSVELGWRRALRTILASDGVNLLAAITLYILTVGNVRGFAFTLGLTTFVDVFVVMFFTHPMMQLLANTRFFGEGHHFSGLSPTLLGASAHGPLRRGATSSKQLTIAERKAEQQAESAEQQEPDAAAEDVVPDAGADTAPDDHDQKGQS
ncbi:MAG: protein translocase subunit SecD [Pseudoclavibacter sp.]